MGPALQATQAKSAGWALATSVCFLPCFLYCSITTEVEQHYHDPPEASPYHCSFPGTEKSGGG